MTLRICCFSALFTMFCALATACGVRTQLDISSERPRPDGGHFQMDGSPGRDSGFDAGLRPDAGACRDDRDCDDGLVCNGFEVCVSGRCVVAPSLPCEDGIFCTIDECIEGVGCVSEPDSSRCAPTETCIVGSGCLECIPSAPVEFACFDGLDDDCDGLLDCADADCDFQCGPPTEFDCRNGLDDDGDGFADCADGDCAFDPRCRIDGGPNFDGGFRFDAGPRFDGGFRFDAGPRFDGGFRFDAGPRVDGGFRFDAGPRFDAEIGIAACTNGIDDDGDGRADCRDPDCAPFGPSSECCNGIDDDGDGAADLFTCRCFDDSTCVGVGDLEQVCWVSSFSLCAPRCNFYGGDEFCRMATPAFPRCNVMTGECIR